MFRNFEIMLKCYNIVNTYCATTVLICVIFLAIVFQSTRRRHGIPTGPPRLPIIGNLFLLCTKDMDKTMLTLRQKYGNIFSLYIGQELVIVLNGYEVIHEALVCKGRTFANRPNSVLEKLFNKDSGILFSNGRTWKMQRKFTQQTLKHICHQNHAQNINDILKEETKYVIQELIKTLGNTNMKHVIDVYSLNVIFRLVFGQRFTFDDPNALVFINTFHDIATDLSRLQIILNCFPLIQNFPVDIMQLKRLYSKQQHLLSLARKFQNQCVDSDPPNMFFVAFKEKCIAEQNNNKDTLFTMEQNDATCMDLIGAASDTTANAILWILLYLIREPHVQDKIYQEIHGLLEFEQEISLDNRNLLPYTQAVILEGLRISSSTPFALPHAAADDIYINNSLIPKGCTVLVNLTSVLKDPSIFNEPDNFKPERFLSQDGTAVIIPKEFVAFSLGPRSCLGQSLARKEMFILVSSLMKHFKLLPEERGSVPGNGGQLGTVLKPLPFKVRIIKR